MIDTRHNRRSQDGRICRETCSLWFGRRSNFTFVLVACSFAGCWNRLDLDNPKPADVPKLIAMVEDRGLSIDDRAAAIVALGELGADSGPALPALIAALADAQTKQFATKSLFKIGRTAVPALIACVEQEQTTDPHRRQAIVILGRIGPDAEDAAPLLVSLLTAEDQTMSASAGATLRRIGEPAVPHLVKLMDQQEPRIRRIALQILSDIGPDEADIGPLLISCLQDEDEEIRKLAGRTLIGIGEPAVAFLLKASSEGDLKTRVAALAVIRRFDKQRERFIPALNELLQDNQPIVRTAAADALLGLGSKDPRSARLLIGALNDPDETVRRAAAAALRWVSPVTIEMVDALLEALNDESLLVRRSAADTIRRKSSGWKGEIKRIGPELVRLLENEDAEIRASAAEAIFRSHYVSADAIAPFVGALADQDDRVREYATAMLAGIGSPAVPAAILALNDDDIVVAHSGLSVFSKMAAHLNAKYARISLSQAEVTKIITSMLGALGRPELRDQTISTLGRFGERAAPAVPALVKMLTDEEHRARATSALRGIGMPAMPLLTEAVEHGSPAVRIAAVEALAGTGGPALPALLKALEDQSVEVRVASLTALKGVGKPAIAVLIAALDDEASQVRRAAMESLQSMGWGDTSVVVEALAKALADTEKRLASLQLLGQMGPRAKVAAPAIIEYLNDDDEKTRTAAFSALSQIDEQALVREVRK